MFKKGQTVYTVANHAISEWVFVGPVGLGDRPCSPNDKRVVCLQSPGLPGYKTYEMPHRVFGTRSAAILARIAQLQKTVKSLLTSAENHKATIRKLQREVKKLK